MKSASLAELKKELKTMSSDSLLEYCIRLAKHKTENKELLTYLIFESDNEALYIEGVKDEVDALFEDINMHQAYLAKKTVRKIVRHIAKHAKFSGNGLTELELWIHFCKKTQGAPLAKLIRSNSVLEGIYFRQLKKVSKLIDLLHEDLQYDYRKATENFYL